MKSRRLVYLFVLTVFAFSFGSYTQAQQTYCSTDVPLFVGLGSQIIMSTLAVPDTGRVDNITVSLQIDHTAIDDLDISLTSPAGTTVELVDRVPSLGDNFGTTCDPFPDFILDDNATTPVADYVAGTAGSFIPENPLSSFNGDPLQGTWTLTVRDNFVLADGGDLNCWCITTTSIQRTVPTLSEWGLIAMAALLGVAGFIVMRRRAVTA